MNRVLAIAIFFLANFSLCNHQQLKEAIMDIFQDGLQGVYDKIEDLFDGKGG